MKKYRLFIFICVFIFSSLSITYAHGERLEERVDFHNREDHELSVSEKEQDFLSLLQILGVITKEEKNQFININEGINQQEFLDLLDRIIVQADKRVKTIKGPNEELFNKEMTKKDMIEVLYNLIHSRPLKRIGFYAVQSFDQMGKLPLQIMFEEIAFGWGSLTRLEGNTISFSMKDPSSEYRKPDGYRQALTLAAQSNIGQKLMITEPRSSLLYDFLMDDQAQEKAIEGIYYALKEDGFSGVVVDFENLRNKEGIYKDKYTVFLKKLRKKMDVDGFSLSVAVQPNNVVGFFDGYDYKEISKVADEIILMAYDYYDRNSLMKPMDHAPLLKVKEALENIMKEGVPKDKIILGIQVAGATQWIFPLSPEDEGVLPSDKIYTPAMTRVYERIKGNNIEGIKGFDEHTMTPFYQYTFDDNGIKRHSIIRYEDERSIEIKKMLAKYYGIKGISIWRIGEIQEDIIDSLCH